MTLPISLNAKNGIRAINAIPGRHISPLRLPGPITGRLSEMEALRNGRSPAHSNYHLFEDVKTGKEDGEYQRLVQDRVDKRLP